MAFQEQTTQGQGTGPIAEELRTVTIFETLEREGLDEFIGAVREAGLEHVLRGISPLTVFVPEAGALGTHPPNREEIENVIAQGRQLVADLRTVCQLKTRAGNTLRVQWSEADVRLGGARIIRSDIACTNGMIHVTDKLARV
ncbi:MAG TPA: fasciclin domain-containing protein [Bryobacteraceae bacterium]|nr:fasciclin domain-containing protein [Bryobacteraceae bacterium]